MNTETMTVEPRTVSLEGPEQWNEKAPGPLAPTQPAAQPRTTVIREERQQARQQSVERVMVTHSPELHELFAALAKAQGMFENVDRTRSARIKSKRDGGADYSFEYETLADVIEATRKGLSENGLAVMQFPFPGASTLTLRTMLTHGSGQWIANDLFAATDGLDPRSLASVITYLQRYSRKAILGIAASDDDDDAQAATQAVAPRSGQRLSQQPPAPRQNEPSRLDEVVPEPVHQDGKPKPVGRVAKIEEMANGAAKVVLDSGFAAGVRDADIRKSLEVFRDTKATVALACESAKRVGYLPWVVEAKIVKREAE